MIGQEVRLTAATQAAKRHWIANKSALDANQPRLADDLSWIGDDVEWVFGRDGSLTAREIGRWWSGSSLPQRTAESVLARLDFKQPAACFLAPTHAAQVVFALSRLPVGGTLIAIVPELRDLRIMLGCAAFDADIRAGRLWFIGGDWQGELRRLLESEEGLVTPGQFIRTNLTDGALVESMIAPAEEIFRAENARRTGRMESIFRSAPRSESIAVIAPSAFRLWDDAGNVLAQIAREGRWRSFDPDDARANSPLALAEQAAGCRAIVTADIFRGDLPASLPGSTAVVTWLTSPRIVRYEPRNANDRVLCADPAWRKALIAAGWPADHVALAAWPVQSISATGRTLAIIQNTARIPAPEFDLSSQRLVWDAIANELRDNPFAAGHDAARYLRKWLDRAGVAAESVNVRLFLEHLIMPAYAQGVARLLIQGGVEVRLFGRGWDQLDEFRAQSAGEINDRAELAGAIESATALVHVWPSASSHPIEASGRAVLHGTDRQTFVAAARRVIPPTPSRDAISSQLIARMFSDDSSVKAA